MSHQVLQQDDEGLGRIKLEGRWTGEEAGSVQARLVDEGTGVPVTAALDWRPAETFDDGHWHAALDAIPPGGLYRLETRFNPDSNPAGEWSPRGDLRHFLGVGDLWVIAGQSNAAGYGRGPYHDPPELGIALFRNSETWALAAHPMNDSTDTRHPVNREGGNPAHSPYLHFARLLRQRLGHPIGLVQTSLGGSALSLWDPHAAGGAPLFENMVHCVERVGGRVRGILWYQGESDTGTDRDAATYAERFTRAVRAWRDALEAPDLPVLTVQINRMHGPADPDADRRWCQVREAQRQAARQLAGVTVVPSLDLPLTDGVHTAPGGNLLLAERLARSALGAVYGRPIDHLAPDLQSARLVAGRRLELSFANVTSRMECIDPTANCFRVADERGDVPIQGVAYPGDATVALALGREPTGRALVHGAWGADPAAAPIDVERILPMLGFSACAGLSDGSSRSSR